jgi:hypothetical protein
MSGENRADADKIVLMGGRRRPDETPPAEYLPGDYGRFDGVWYAMCPQGRTVYNLGLLGALSGHEVTEHDDGTLTVSPSIVADGWHGWLERGVWRSV